MNGGLNTLVSLGDSCSSFAPSTTSPVLSTGPEDEFDPSLLAALVSSLTSAII